jgi:non-ribosomal peptide synthetase component F
VVAHRERSEVEPLIGCFTKKVPLRLRVDGAPTFSELVARTRGSLLGALAHQDLAFEEAVREGLGPAAAAHGVVPQVAVVFQAETPQKVRLALPGLAIGPYDAGASARQERHFSSGPDRPAEAPVWGDGIYSGTFLILSLLETTDGMALIARGVFDRPSTVRLLDDLRTLLEEVIAEPERPVSVERADVPDADMIEVRGFRARRSRLEAALATCPGVTGVEVAVSGEGPRLVVSVVAGGEAPPTVDDLRHALWSELPGTVWPAEAVGVAPPSRPHPRAELLAAMWGEVRGRPASPSSSYWQDFSFLRLLAEARDAGLTIPDDHVVHCRTIETLAAAMRLP